MSIAHAPLSDEAAMGLALAQAQAAQSEGEVPVGAVVVHQGRVVGAGHNSPIGDHDPTAHAEVKAMRQAAQNLGNYRLEDCTLYVTLEPCAMCAMALVHARVKRVVYAAADPKTGACGSVFDVLGDSRHNHKVEVQGGLLCDEAGTRLSAYFKAKRRAG